MLKLSFVMLVVVALSLSLAGSIGFTAEKKEDAIEISEILEKLDQVLDNQAQILGQFEQIKKELTVVKIRCTR